MLARVDRGSLSCLGLSVGLGIAACSDGGSTQPATGTETAATGSSAAGEGASSGRGDRGESSAGSEGGVTPPSGECPRPEDGPTVSDELVHLGRGEGDTFIEILDVVVADTTVYACTATQGLTIWDASDPSAPALLHQNVAPEGLSHGQFPRCQHIVLQGDRAVITNRGDEVQPTPWLALYDISSATPALVASWSGTESIEGVAFDGTTIFAAAHRDGVLAFEQNGTDLVEVGRAGDASSDAWLPVLKGDTLWVAEGATGLRSYDVSAGVPALRATLAIEGSSKDVVLDAEDRAYVAASSAIAAVDVGDPASPALLGQVAALGTVLEVALGPDDTVFTAEWDEVRGYDVSDPAAMHQIASEVVPTNDSFSRVLALEATADGRVFAGEWTGMHALQFDPTGRAPDVYATPSSIQFPRLEEGEVDDRVLVVRNLGAERLDVYDAGFDTVDLDVAPKCFSVEPGEARALEVTFAPSAPAQFRGNLLLATNDPDEDQFSVSVSGNIVGRDIGDPAPEFMLTDLDGQMWSNSDLEGSVAVLAYFATF